MKQIIDFLPVVAFFGVWLATGRDIYYATAALMGAAVIQLAVFKLKAWPIPGQVWFVFWAAMIFGTMTLVFRNPLFIQWRPTVVNWILALVIIGSRFVGRGNYVQRALGKVMVLPDRAWRALTYGWAGVFALSGTVNIWVAYTFSEDAWVYYKFVSGFVVSFLLVGGSFIYLAATGQLPSLPAKGDLEASQSRQQESTPSRDGNP